MVWMQSLCNDMRGCIGPLLLNIKKRPEAYLPFLHSILRDMESYNQLGILKDKEQKPIKLFCLLLQKHLRPINIKINNTVLADMHKYLGTGEQLEGHDLWYFYFDTRLAMRLGRKKFEEFMVTDRLSTTLIVSCPKRVVEEVMAGTENRRRKGCSNSTKEPTILWQ